jgi:hypothetical protein
MTPELFPAIGIWQSRRFYALVVDEEKSVFIEVALGEGVVGIISQASAVFAFEAVNQKKSFGQ